MNNGIISGLLLYILLCIGDRLVGTETERILLNIDFITRQKDLPLWLELIPHLLVSVVVYIILKWIYRYTDWMNIAMVSIIKIFIILYFVLTQIALYNDNKISIQSFTIWMAGHIIYLMIVYRLIRREAQHANI
ncbi:hypothetical protein [Macrococcoides caseolyticum]|uniref:hypothetical protein n=1 Tax=Macrococcoides caseolyticum TaxID=69966 RepID=UPI001F2A31ED|nr:hypothetical protein [Macrococcus caseolyticus]MCE4956591.1 hypothetical protein [Macrococcus caseolyticus]